ncbi:serine protease, S1-C subfamily, contains C-terminal PDZ domain [Propionibacterium cyclohexanicum]|uniref:Serine protease, S1-C subfamily, contains C-terminal PDZ domain n=1 Tax=Propionibacterium cyclohexanicum TaxID=64702 RepID=A0A1H9T5L2_9ACTN|nr:serine protease, S1-C subfamily, contains C-terminal PDZ domain [Propionibacterium cyclohexanicum]
MLASLFEAGTHPVMMWKGSQMDERHENNDAWSGAAAPSEHGQDTPATSGGSGEQGYGAPTGWSAPEGYWGASSAAPQPGEARAFTSPSGDRDWTSQTLHDDAAPSGEPGPRSQGQYRPGPYPQAPAGSQSDWDAWYSSFSGGYPTDPNGPLGPASTGGRPPRRGWGARIAAVIAGLALLIAAAASIIVPNLRSSGLLPLAPSSSASGYPGQGGSGSSSDASGPSSSQIGTGQTSVQTQTDASAQQSKGVVLIDTTTTSGSAAGTGMVLSADGYVLTNYHVVESSTAIKATLASNSKTYTATVVGHDATNDVALLKLSGASGLTPVSLDDDGVKIGDKVTAVGNSQGQGFLSAAPGSITSTSATVTVSSELSSTGSETLKDVYQTDAQAVPGDSGGPLYDSENEVVGITTAGEQSNSGPQGQTSTVASWAVPIARALSIVDQIESGKESATVRIGPKAYLGVTVQASPAGGLVIAQVVAGGPADRAGLQVGDSVTAINGTPIANQSDLSDALDELEPGEKARLSVIDGSSGAENTVTLTLGSSPIN